LIGAFIFKYLESVKDISTWVFSLSGNNMATFLNEIPLTSISTLSFAKNCPFCDNSLIEVN